MRQLKPKLLIISFVNPYPPDDGGKISLFSTVDYLRKSFKITLVFKIHKEIEYSYLKELYKIWPEVELKHFQPNYQKKKTTNDKGLTIKQKVKNTIKQLKDYLSVKKKNLINYKATSDLYESNLDKYELFMHAFRPVSSKFILFLSKILNENKFDIIQVEYSPNLNLINILPKESIKIFVQIESQYLIIQDYLNIKNNFTAQYNNYLVSSTKTLELHLLSRYDAIFVLNKKDEYRIKLEFPNSKIFYSPFAILDDKIKAIGQSFIPNKLIFLGSQNHFPNEDSLRWFIDQVYAKSNNDLPKLYITGKWSESFKKKYQNKNIIFTGYLASLEVVMIGAVLISPIRIGGGGIRVKILEAMAFGIPVITSSLGIEGIEEAKDKIHVEIADSPEKIIKSIKKLFGNPKYCYKLIHNANELVKNHYNQKTTGEIRKKLYQNLLSANNPN